MSCIRSATGLFIIVFIVVLLSFCRGSIDGGSRSDAMAALCISSGVVGSPPAMPCAAVCAFVVVMVWFCSMAESGRVRGFGFGFVTRFLLVFGVGPFPVVFVCLCVWLLRVCWCGCVADLSVMLGSVR